MPPAITKNIKPNEPELCSLRSASISHQFFIGTVFQKLALSRNLTECRQA